MSGFDLPPLGGFDLTQVQRGALRNLMPSPPAIQDPERVGVPSTGAPTIDTSPSSSFAGVLENAVNHVQALQDDVQQKTRGLALGEDVELHDVLIASNKSEVAFNLLLEVRNKLVDAWDKISRSAG